MATNLCPLFPSGPVFLGGVSVSVALSHQPLSLCMFFCANLSECTSFVRNDAGCCGDSDNVKLWWCRINWKGVSAATAYEHKHTSTLVRLWLNLIGLKCCVAKY